MEIWELEIIDRNFDYLIEITSVDDSFVKKLTDKGLLSPIDLKQLEEIRACREPIDQASWIYKTMRAKRFTRDRRPVFDTFIEALNENGQSNPTNLFWQERDAHHQGSHVPLPSEPMVAKEQYTIDTTLRRLNVEVQLPVKSMLPTFPRDAAVLQYADKGVALIINVRNFSLDGVKINHIRKGSEWDVMYLRSLFKQLGYKIFKENQIIWEDQTWTKQEILDTLKDFQQYCNQEKPRSAIVFIGSHGENNSIFTSDFPAILTDDEGDQIVAHEKIKLWEDVFSLFYDNVCPGLAGKPKLFFISACQVFRGSDVESDLETPVTDFLVCSAQAPGFSSFRDTQSGSRFAHCLAYFMMKYAKDKSLLEILNMVVDALKDIKTKISVEKGKDIEHGQVPSIFNLGLTKPLYLAVKPYHEN